MSLPPSLKFQNFEEQTPRSSSLPPMEKTHHITLTRMRNSVEKLGSSTQEYEDVTLMRFLIARSMDPEKAAKMFVGWLKWRREFVPKGFIPQSEVEDELNAKKMFLQGLNRDGNPVVIAKVKLHSPSKDHLQLKKFVVHFVDKTIASSFRGKEKGNEKMIVIMDLHNISYKNLDTRGLIAGFQFLQAYYPERLGKLYIWHMPKIFVSVWKIVCRFLEKATLKKIVIVRNEEERRNAVKEIGEDIVPEEYGGRAKLVLIQDVSVPALEGSL